MDQIQRCLARLNKLTDEQFSDLIRNSPTGANGLNHNKSRKYYIDAVPRWGDREKASLNQLCRAIGVQTDESLAHSSNRISKINILFSAIAAFAAVYSMYLLVQDHRTGVQPPELSAQRLRTADERKQLALSQNAFLKGDVLIQENSGNSIPIRGLDLYLLRDQADREKFTNLKKSLVTTIEKTVKIYERREAIRAGMSKEELRSGYGSHLVRTSGRDKILSFHMKKMNQKEIEISKFNKIDLRHVYELHTHLSLPPGLHEAAWQEIISDQTVNHVRTDFDGTFEIEAMPGKYYIYAKKIVDGTENEWFIPFNAESGMEYTRYLTNENTTRRVPKWGK